MAPITEKPAVVLDKDYLKHVTSAQKAGGTVSRSLCAAAVKETLQSRQGVSLSGTIFWQGATMLQRQSGVYLIWQ